MTLSEHTANIIIPEGTRKVANVTMRVFLVVNHPLAEDHNFSGDIRRMLPLARVSIAETHARAIDNRFWEPQESDLSEAGRMLVAFVLDQYPERGSHRIAFSMVPHEMAELPLEVQEEIVRHCLAMHSDATGTIH